MSKGKEVLVGVVIVVAVTLGVVGTLWLQESLGGRDQRRVYILSRDVGQLMNGNDVKFRGVDVGQVERIEVAAGGQAVRVTVRVREDLPMPDDPVAVFAPESMFGDWQVELAPRDRYEFEFMEVPETQRDSVIGGFALPDLSRLTATADQISRDIATITERVEVAFTQETAHNIARTIDNIEAVSQRLARLVETQATALEDMGDEVLSTVREIRVAAQTARSTMENVDSLVTMAQADSILEDTRSITRNLKVFSDSLSLRSGSLARTLALADSAVTDLHAITSRIEAGRGSLGRLVNDTAFVAQTELTLAELESLLRDFRQNPRRYINLSIF